MFLYVTNALLAAASGAVCAWFALRKRVGSNPCAGTYCPAVGFPMVDDAMVRASLERSGEAIYWIARDGRILWANKTAGWILGYTAEELATKRAWEISARRDRDDEKRWHDFVQTVQSSGEMTFEAAQRSKAGDLVPVVVTVSLVHEVEGDFALCVFVRDLRGEIAKVEEFQAKAGEIQAFFATSLDLLCIADLDGQLLRMSESWAHILGHRLDDMLGEAFLEFVHPDDLKATVVATERLSAGEEIVGFRNRYRCADGTYRTLDWQARVVRGRIYGTARDVTETEAWQREIEALERRMRMFVEHTPAAVAMFDRDVNYLVASRGWYEQYGLEDDVIGKCHYDVFPTIPQRWKEHHRRCLAGDVLQEERDSFEAEDGSVVWLAWRLEPWHDRDGEIAGIVMFTSVITEQVRFEQELAEARDAAEAASRSKSDFVANMSHEIRTPMTAILGFADMIDSEDRETSAQAVSTIRDNARHLLAIINDILDVSKIEAGRLEIERVATRPAAIVEDIVALMAPRVEEKRIDLSVDVQEAVPQRVVSDPTRLRQILLNLVSNAVKFTDRGSVSIDVSYRGAVLRFDVHDSGIGMTQEQRERIARFDAFTQADTTTTRRFGGTGLGLRITAQLARLMGGQLFVESQEGEGSVFSVEVEAPRDEGAGSIDGARASADVPTADALAGQRVLVVDDGPDNRRLLQFYLQKAGAEVELVEGGVEAVQRLCSDDGDRFDVVLMDMQMPEVDGYEATAQLRSRGRDLPIIAITAHAMDGDRDRCLAAGCDEYLTKPIDRAALIRTVRDTRHVP